MTIPCYPGFEPLVLDMQDTIQSALSLTSDGISEFSFACLYLFRNRYHYEVSRTADGGLILSGTTPESHTPSPMGHPPSQEAPSVTAPEPAAIVSLPQPEPGTKFFLTPCGFPGFDTLESLFKNHTYWKNIPPSVLNADFDGVPLKQKLEEWGLTISEDRDNFDYLYLRSDLAALSGKKYHRKKNLVNAFMNAWPDHEERVLESALIPDALAILEHWRRDKGESAEASDYFSTKEALELFDVLGMQGAIYYVAGRPAAFCLGESLARGKMFAVHFEKALEQYKGIYQYMNQAFAASLSPEYTEINREQDLGSEGLRQAKMTYRPVGFVKKYRGAKN